jgi:hypothetical protein
MISGIVEARSRRPIFITYGSPSQVHRVQRTDGVLELVASSFTLFFPLDDERPAILYQNSYGSQPVELAVKYMDCLGEPFPHPRPAGLIAVPERIEYSNPDDASSYFRVTLYDDSPLPKAESSASE